jgi:hypothetical protein
MSNYQRLSVNINEESAQILREVTQDRGITTTEAIRRAIALLGFFEQARRTETTLWAEDKKGEKTQLHVV